MAGPNETDKFVADVCFRFNWIRPLSLCTFMYVCVCSPLKSSDPINGLINTFGRTGATRRERKMTGAIWKARIANQRRQILLGDDL